LERELAEKLKKLRQPTPKGNSDRTFLLAVSLLIMLWGTGGIVITIYNTFIADSPPYMDYDWVEVMSRQILIFGVGCLIYSVGAVLHTIAFIYEKNLD